MADNQSAIEYKRGFLLASRQRVTRRTFTADDFAPRPPSMGDAPDQSSKEFDCKLWVAGHLVNDTLLTFSDLKFSDAATPWEMDRSILCSRGGWTAMTPVALETPFLRRVGMATVVGHHGTVRGDELIAPQGSRGLFVQEKLALGVPVFVMRTRQQTPSPKWDTVGVSDQTLTVLTAVDGRLLAVYGSTWRSDAEAEDGPVEFVRDMVIGDALIEVAVGAARALKVFRVLEAAPAESQATRMLMAGPTEDVAALFIKSERLAGVLPTVREVGLDEAMAARGLKFGGYERRMGIPPPHLQAVREAARETNTVIVLRANKEAAIDLIEKGAVGKPKALSIPGFSSSETTGVLTARTAEQIKVVTTNRYYLLEMQNGKPMMRLGAELKPYPGTPYWQVEEGQVLDAAGNPVVGDYDGLGAWSLDSPGRNIGLVPSDPVKGDWMGAAWDRAMKAINRRLDRPRVLHGAQDFFPDIKNAGKYGGFVNGGAYAVFPDGRVIFLNGKAEQQVFYEAFERQTAIGSYNPAGSAAAPRTYTGPPNLRVVK